MTRTKQMKKAARKYNSEANLQKAFIAGAQWACNTFLNENDVRPKHKITKEMIANRDLYLKVVSHLTSIDATDIMSIKRYRPVVKARFLLMWSLYRLLGYSLTQIGQLIGRNHASIYYGINTIEHVASHKGGEQERDIMTVLKNFSQNNNDTKNK